MQFLIKLSYYYCIVENSRMHVFDLKSIISDIEQIHGVCGYCRVCERVCAQHTSSFQILL